MSVTRATACPFCGYTRVRVEHDYDGAFARCTHYQCKARGPVFRAYRVPRGQRHALEEDGALRLWNGRTDEAWEQESTPAGHCGH